jgi:glucokinase
MSDIGEAEIGHIVVLPGGPPCCCGNRGCVESVCSGPGITQLAALVAGEADQLWRESSLSAGEPGNPAVSSKDLLAAWERGDRFATEVIRRAANYLGSAIASAMNLLSPDIFIVGGGLGSASLPLLKQIADSARPLVVPCFRDRFQLVRAELGEGAVTHGAALLAASTEPPPEPPAHSQHDAGT